MPSISEPFGLVPLESIHFGTPALVTKQSGVAEVLHNALKVDYWDTDSMANQITAVIQSNNLSSTLLEAQQDDLRRSCWSNSVKNIVSIYKNSMRLTT
jgi:glycosyltransferase involved in cell wall biosynthesis